MTDTTTVKKTIRFVTTKRATANDTIAWVLSHYDDLDRTLLREAARVMTLPKVTNQQWNDFWTNRGFQEEVDAARYAELKGMPNVVRLTKNDVYEALKIIAGEA
jgi:hypothetical protein